MNTAKWFHIIGVGYVFCTYSDLRSALPLYWRIDQTEHSGIAFR